ncbi:hypothetical protein F5X96DRAFT_675339 [Biscogniauxia mediterranea]|nr:hypothetical protein F5X96DRAFT_675339 [Biscogniauxia mediterranea]
MDRPTIQDAVVHNEDFWNMNFESEGFNIFGDPSHPSSHRNHKAMRYDTYKTSLELVAAFLVISTYEMLGGSGPELGKTSLRRALSPAIPSDHPRRLGGPAAGRVVAWLC